MCASIIVDFSIYPTFFSGSIYRLKRFMHFASLAKISGIWPDIPVSARHWFSSVPRLVLPAFPPYNTCKEAQASGKETAHESGSSH